jgi:PTS system mannose-specific IID component
MGTEHLPRRVRGAVLVRSFLVQAAWNYRTMMGTGMAFALVPVLRYVHRDRDDFDRAVARHASLFNAHPYLASFAIGALARMEAERADQETIERFRAALRGPLGAMGDRLVWAAWLPMCALLGIVVTYTTSAAAGVGVFFVVYNFGQLALRAWGFEVGWSAGTHLGRRLRELRLTRETRRIEAAVCVLAGVVSGMLLIGVEAASPTPIPMLAGTLALVAGYAAGPRAWRPTAWLVTLGVGVLALAGHFLPL